MSREVYAALEAQMLQYQDIAGIPVESNNEPLVALVQSPTLVAHQLRDEMLSITGDKIYVRETVARMLGAVSIQLDSQVPGTQLQVGYGYRALSIQKTNFDRQRARLQGTVPDSELDAATHRYVAIPDIAAHPAGAAVDVRMLRGGEPVDCGTDMWEFIPDTYTFSPYVSRSARDNRLLLRSAMMGAGFAPFDGEWWHFSYGDKEWATYYDKPAAFYEQLEFSTNPDIRVQ